MGVPVCTISETLTSKPSRVERSRSKGRAGGGMCVTKLPGRVGAELDKKPAKNLRLTNSSGGT